LRKIAQYSLANKEEFEALVKSSLAKEQTEEIKKQLEEAGAKVEIK